MGLVKFIVLLYTSYSIFFLPCVGE